MTPKEKLAALRGDIDALDNELITLFQKRMAISDTVADIKIEGNLAMVDATREQQIVQRVMQKGETPAEQGEIAGFMRSLMAFSKMRQSQKLFSGLTLGFPEIAAPKAGSLKVAFQGVAGAWGQKAAGTLYPEAELCPSEDFEDVFLSVKDGRADYGVLPIENSQTGAIGEVYDLLRRHGCFVVGETWIGIAQCLLGLPGTALAEVREVVSHPEGLKQCRRFLRSHAWDLTACRNTAYAAQMVADKKEKRLAAIGSRLAAEIYGLEVLVPDIMDNRQNQTRFIAIAAQPEADESCDTTFITFSTTHVAGALCSVLQTFMVAGINLSRIESRPVSAEKYRFFADLQASVLRPETMETLKQAAQHCDYFEILGCGQARR